jgi:hypothetical protein
MFFLARVCPWTGKIRRRPSSLSMLREVAVQKIAPKQGGASRKILMRIMVQEAPLQETLVEVFLPVPRLLQGLSALPLVPQFPCH